MRLRSLPFGFGEGWDRRDRRHIAKLLERCGLLEKSPAGGAGTKREGSSGDQLLAHSPASRVVVGPAGRQCRGEALEFLTTTTSCFYSGVHVALCDGVIQLKRGSPKTTRSGMFG